MKESLVEVALIESETSIPCYPLYLEGVHVLERRKEGGSLLKALCSLLEVK
jgi:hypothetical protein